MNKINEGRHCERSEAIHEFEIASATLLNAASQ